MILTDENGKQTNAWKGYRLQAKSAIIYNFLSSM